MGTDVPWPCKQEGSGTVLPCVSGPGVAQALIHVGLGFSDFNDPHVYTVGILCDPPLHM